MKSNETEVILKNIRRHITLDVQERDYILSILTHKQVLKKEYLLTENQPCQHLYFINSGVLRAFCIDKEGKESTVMFAVKDWWITDMYCFLNQKPSMTYIQAVENTCIFQLSKENFDNLMVKIPKFERFFRILMQNAYTREQLRIIENLTLTAAERYDNFIKKYPHIVELITQKQIASYLGITPEFLSVIRQNKLKKA